MLSLNRDFVFVHVPKTGGTAVETVLAPYADAIVFDASAFADPSVNFRHKHATALMIRNGMGEAAFAAAFKFAVVRNPWDWVTSNYLGNPGGHLPWWMPPRQVVLDDILSLRSLTFAEWLPRWITVNS